MIISTITQGLIFAIMVLGVYISYKILDFPDLTVDGSFPLGAAVLSSSLLLGAPVGIAILLSVIAGAVAGFITGIIHTKFEITNLLSGIIVMIGLYSINLRIMGKSNINLFSVKHLFSNGNDFLIMMVIVLVVKILLDILFKTKIGFLIRLVGDNPSLIEALGENTNKYKVIGLMLANSLVALSGGLLAQYQSFSDINMGTGMLVMGLASIILGETMTGSFKFIKLTTAAIVGSVVYRLILAFSLSLGFATSDLKLLTAAILLGILILNKKKKHKNRFVNKNKLINKNKPMDKEVSEVKSVA